MADDATLLDRLRAAIHEHQMAQYVAESTQREADASKGHAEKLHRVVVELEDELRASLHESGPYHFSRRESKMVYRG